MRTSHYHKWVLMTLILAVLPSLVVLPIWVTVIALCGIALHYLPALHKGKRSKEVTAILLLTTSIAIWLSFDSYFSGKAILSFFVAVVFIKWGESKSRRDFLLLIFAAVILAAVGALYFENLWSMIHVFVVVFSLSLSLIAIHIDPELAKGKFLFRFATQVFLLSLPLMALMFVTFPRIPGPLWDIGLAFGLPVKVLMEKSSQDHGKTMVLKPGMNQQARQDNSNVLIAEFKGAVPFKSRLYWRGPVYWDYDGENWNLPKNWDNRGRLLKKAIRSKSKLQKELRWKGTPVNYTLRVMPNGGRWLYGLDVPAAPAPEAFISDEFQLLSIRKSSGNREPKFPMTSYLDYNIGSSLSAEQRARALAIPEGANPRLQAFGQEIAAKTQDSHEVLHEVFTHLAKGSYQFDNAHLLASGKDLLDRYFFDEKKGGAEYLAGSFVMLMRAAGVPSRLVSGYRGGTIIALTNFVIVKRADAHVWAEVWHEDKGWVRAEPKDIILPPVKKPRATSKEKTVQSTPKVKIDLEDVKDNSKKQSSPGSTEAKEEDEKSEAWEMPSLASLFGDLQKWVIDYNPDRQTEILEGMGAKKTRWFDLMLMGLVALLIMIGVYVAVAWWRSRKTVDPVAKAWQKFCAQMAKKGLEKRPQDCPRSYLKMICQECPDFSEASKDIVGRYIDIRYGECRSNQDIKEFFRQIDRFVGMT